MSKRPILDSVRTKAHAQLFTKGADYAKFRPTYPPALFESLKQYQQTIWNDDAKYELVVDVGCGTGQATKVLAKTFNQVIGIDGSAKQLQSAFQSDNIVYKVGTSDDLPVADSSTDLVTVAQAFHWFDFEKFYKEAIRILKPSGILAVWTYGLARLDNESADKAFINYHTNVLGPYWSERRKLVDSGYKSVSFPPAFEMQQRLHPPMSFEMTIEQFFLYLGTQSALKTFKEKHPEREDPRDKLKKEIMQFYNSEDAGSTKVTVSFELTLLLGTLKRKDAEH